MCEAVTVSPGFISRVGGLCRLVSRVGNISARRKPGLLVRRAICVALCGILSACGTLNSTPGISVAGNEQFVLLPFENLSITPQADTRLQRLVETHLRTAGVHNVSVYSQPQPTSLKAILDTRYQVDKALQQVAASGARYAVSGSVHEWQYNNGADREPVVGITLSLIDLGTGDVLWQGNAAKSGWGSASLSATADSTVEELLHQLRFVASDHQNMSVNP